MSGPGWRWRLYRSALGLYARLPMPARQALVRTAGPSFAVGSIVAIEDGPRLLLVKPSYRKGWGFAGGLIQRGETPAACAVREVREELGVRIELIEPGTLVVDVGPRRIDFVFRATLVGGEQPEARSAEIADLAWFPRDGLPELLFEAETALQALADQGAGPLVLPATIDSRWLG